MDVAVIAGTPFDAGLGADLVRAAGLTANPYPMAASPDEQDTLQYGSPDALRASFMDLVREVGDQGFDVALLFCNSLSAVVDHDAVARVSPVRLISPVAVYREVAAEFRRPLVLTGNGSAIVGYERIAASVSATHRALGVSDPALVRAIEDGDPADAFRGSNLPATLRLAEAIGLDAAVLACTHLTTVLPLAAAICGIPVIDVGTRLVELTVDAVDASATSRALGRRAA